MYPELDAVSKRFGDRALEVVRKRGEAASVRHEGRRLEGGGD